MNKNIVLIYPKVGDQKIISAVAHSILALEKPLTDNGYNVSLIDEKVKEHNFKKIFNENNVAGFSVMTGPQIKYALKLTKLAKKINPKIKIIWGGWHATILPKQTIAETLIDYVCMGEGEKRIITILDHIFNNISLKNISGIAYKENNKIIVNNYDPNLKENITFIDYKRYDLSEYTKNGKIDLISSFGCPYKCAFCSQNSIFGKNWQAQKSIELVKTLIHINKKYNVYEFEFVDTNFFVSKKRVLEIAELILKNKLNIKWGGSIRADQLMRYTENEFQKIVDSGFSTAAIGFESASEKILKFIEKQEPVEIYYKTVARCKKYNISLFGTFITGLPTETKKDYLETRNFILFMKKDYPNSRVVLLYYTPYPGTPIYEKAIELGFKPPNNLEKWAEFSHNNVNIPWFTKKQKELCDIDIMTIHAENIYDKIDKTKDIYIYGASLSGKIALDMLKNIKITNFVETNRSKTFFENIKVIDYNEFIKLNPKQVIIASYGYQKEIEEIILKKLPDIKIIKLYSKTIFYI